VTARKRRRGARQFPVVRIAVAVLVVLAVTAAMHLLGLLVLALAVGAGGFVGGWRMRARQAPPAGPRRPVGRGSSSPASSPAARRGAGRWLPPAHSTLVCSECAGGSCIWCADSRCECAHPNLPKPAPRPAPVGDVPPF
jgi:hypothetical protein